jgi:hypothetical protein
MDLAVRRSPPSEWRDHLKPGEPLPVVPQRTTLTAEYVGSARPELKGRTALIMRKGGSRVMAQFDYSETAPANWWDFMAHHDPLCHGWHEFTEGEFQELPEDREDRQMRIRRQLTHQERSHGEAVADFGGPDLLNVPQPRARWQELDEESERDLDLLFDIDDGVGDR